MNGCFDGCFLVLAILILVGIIGALATSPAVWLLIAVGILLVYALGDNSKNPNE